MGPQWSCSGVDPHNATLWGLRVAASGWVHQGDPYSQISISERLTGPSLKVGVEIQPLQVDETVSFDDVGGLSGYIHALKEMVFYPLLYPDFFVNYHISPPRGVSLCGPPGTGKTLIARALANAASKVGQKVKFYMRKGADVLSKWVGEAERQLKLLFKEAQRNQPSIIFFDEIDGLAPMRSSKQEQVHNSIVSTLLSLMDGLDSRGQVVLIGATNRIDAIDGALRCPGRFDHELVFPMPDCKARAEILKIHTKKWKDPLSDRLRKELAASCVGYCGVDLNALCTEVAIVAFRQTYPQVYTSDDKLDICVDSMKVEKHHFLEAMSSITPAVHRGVIVYSRPLPPIVAPCLQLQGHMERIKNHLSEIFPVVGKKDVKNSLDCRFHNLSKSLEVSFGSSNPLVYRPKLLICGEEGTGLADGQLKAVLYQLVRELPENLPVLLLATSSMPYEELHNKVASLFWQRYVYPVTIPSKEERTKFFSHLVDFVVTTPNKEVVQTGLEVNTSIDKPVKVLVAVRSQVRPNYKQREMQRIMLFDVSECVFVMCVAGSASINQLFSFSLLLRLEKYLINLLSALHSVLSDKRYSKFHNVVQKEDDLKSPVDLRALLQKVNEGHSLTLSTFLQDVELIPANAYYGHDRKAATIVNKAYAIRDEIYGMITKMDPTLVYFCEKIASHGGQTQKEKFIREGESHTDIEPHLNITSTSEALKCTDFNIDPP
ncbi:hypothetical protein KI387_031588, partial [Taxus chinensis]